MAGSPSGKPRRRWARRAALAGLVLLVLGIPAGVAAWYLRVEPHLRAAEAALDDHDYAAAAEHLARYLEARPNHARAHFLAARPARALRRYDEAEEHLRACRRLGWDEHALDVERRLHDLQEGNASAEPLLRQRAEAGGPDTLPVLEALIDESHRLGRKTGCHVFGGDGLKNTIAAGCDTVEHAYGLTQELADTLCELEINVARRTVAKYREQLGILPSSLR